MRTDLELFVLALVQQGLATPYDLRMKAGISLGSTVPALERLEKNGLVKPSEVGSRRSRKYSITGKGKTELGNWAGHLSENVKDLDAVLRIAYLGWLNGEEDISAKFLQRSAEGLRGWATSLRAEADRLAALHGHVPDGDTFKWLKAYCEAARAEAEATALGELSVQIKTRNKTKKKSGIRKLTRAHQ